MYGSSWDNGRFILFATVLKNYRNPIEPVSSSASLL